MPDLRFISVVPFLPLRQALTYSFNPVRWPDLSVGCRVLVPVGRRQVTGIVVALDVAPDVKGIREIADLLDQVPLVSRELVELTKWMGQYYLCTWGEALRTAVPAGVTIATRKLAALTQPGEAITGLNGIEAKIVAALQQAKKPLLLQTLGRQVKVRELEPHLVQLEKRGLITLLDELSKSKVSAQFEKLVRLTSPAETAAVAPVKKAPRQQACLEMVAQNPDGITLADLVAAGFSYPLVKALEKRGAVMVTDRETMRDPLRDFPVEKRTAFTLTAEQTEAVRRIGAALEERKFETFLLHGVTSSGKTEVYIRLVEQTLAQKRSAIMLVPEIALTPQMVRQFRMAFGTFVAVFHSRLSLGERYDVWRGCARGDYRVVVGARSALFAPLANLGLVVVDEEQETSYKQYDQVPRYHARDTGIMRAKFANAVAVVGSATPSLETFYNAALGRYQLCTLKQRINANPLPAVTIVDMREERRQNNWGVFSRLFAERLRVCLDRGEQAIILQNRRGFSAFLKCRDCGFIFECKNCKVTMAYHLNGLALVCHYCGYQLKAPSVCPQCQGEHIKYKGYGTERIEDELHKLLPQATVIRMDLDTTGEKWAHHTLLERFRRKEAQVLLGTQMIAKGLDFADVTLTGVVSADIGLHLPDFRAEERTFQLLTQLAGRTGRGDKGGEVVIQTSSPNAHSIICAQQHDYTKFYDHEIAARKQYWYPPFSRLALVLMTGPNEAKVKRAAEVWTAHLKDTLKGRTDDAVRVLGPAPAMLQRINKRYRWQIALKCGDTRILHTLLAGLDRQLQGLDKQVRVTIDIDPVDMM